MNHTSAIVLAAGNGTRMKSTKTNKVALKLTDKPIIQHSIQNLMNAGIKDIVVVVGFAKESVISVLGDKVQYAEQKNRLGTGHAVKIGLSKIPENSKYVVSVYGDDSAFYPPKLIQQLISHHEQQNSVITLMSIRKQNPHGLGRIVRSELGKIESIVEEKVATEDQRAITEINTGLYCFDKKFLANNINKIKKNPISHEYYLTDIIEIAVRQGEKVEALLWQDDTVWFGVNRPEELIKAQAQMRLNPTT